MRRRTLYPLLGILLALGAPLGLLLLSAVATGTVPTPAWALGRISGELLVYAYVTFSTAAAFAITGFALGRTVDLLRELSKTDALTGLYNLRHLRYETARETARSQRYGVPLAFLLLDVDGLKAINDRFGHRAGDRALVAVATAIRQHLRESDTPARYGGDEFALLCPHTHGDEALALAERIRWTVQETLDLPARLSVSIGIEWQGDGEARTAEQLFAGADRALYAAKEAGRNRTRSARTLPPPTN